MSHNAARELSKLPDSKDFDTFWRSIAEEYLGPIGGQLEVIAQEMALQTYRRLAGDWRNSEWEVAEKFNLLNDVREHLNPFVGSADFHNKRELDFIELAKKFHGWKAPENILWAFPSAKIAYIEKEVSWNDWPLNTDGLARDVDYYAKFYPNSSPTLERILISALIYGETSAFGEAIKPFLKGSFLYAISGGNEFRLMLMKLVIELGALFFRTAVIIGVGLIAAEAGGLTTGLLAAFFAFVLVNMNLMIGQKFNHNKREETEALLTDMQDLSRKVDEREPVPSYIRYVLELTTKKGAVWPVGLWQLVLMAESRCAWRVI